MSINQTGHAGDNTLIRTAFSFFAIILTILILSDPAIAIPKSSDGFYQTGNGIRHKKVLLVNVRVYHATHEMKLIPNPPTRRNVILAEVDKRTTITMLRDVNIEDILEGIREGYELNNYENDEVMGRFLAPLTEDLEEGDTFRIQYDSTTKSTSLLTRAGKSNIPGKEFMMATWATWFQNHERPEFIEDLMQYLVPPESER